MIATAPEEIGAQICEHIVKNMLATLPKPSELCAGMLARETFHSVGHRNS
jgi:hypothetical protein